MLRLFLGVQQSSYDLTPQQILEEFYKRDPGGDIDKIYAGIIKDAPSLKEAEAALLKARRDLDEANLDLRYCTVVAEIDGGGDSAQRESGQPRSSGPEPHGTYARCAISGWMPISRKRRSATCASARK
jgi:hypothetical protein